MTRPRDFPNAQPLPEASSSIPYSASFSEAEYRKIAQGLRPREMEDRWFAYLEDDVLRIHRSWTGFCIYQVRFAKRGQRHVVIEARVNRDPSQYLESNDDFDARFLRYLVRRRLLGRWARMPTQSRPWWRFG